ncbi:MAG: arsenic efflux protein [Clostridia bacterium]|nr:arsenic efflux protein [Clostridia bacterium]
MHEILHALEHSLLDTLKMLPFLAVAFLILEYAETKLEEKSSAVIQKAGKLGPLASGLLGLIPQCGFSVIGSNFYAKRIITLGSLIAIYLSTSDEALLVMLTKPERILDILLVMGIKLAIAVAAGYIIDLIIRKKAEKDEECHHCHHHGDSCDDEELIGEEHCCSHTDWKAIVKCTLKRTASVFGFLFAASFLLSYIIELIGEARLQEIMLADSVFQPLLTALIGLVPNCAPSVILAELYIEGAISLGSVVSGLCTGAGVGLLVLFRVNRGVKSNIGITALLFGIGAVSGVVIELISSAI